MMVYYARSNYKGELELDTGTSTDMKSASAAVNTTLRASNSNGAVNRESMTNHLLS